MKSVHGCVSTQSAPRTYRSSMRARLPFEMPLPAPAPSASFHAGHVEAGVVRAKDERVRAAKHRCHCRSSSRRSSSRRRAR